MAHNFRNSRSRQSLCLGSHLLEDRLALGVGLERASPELLGLAVGERNMGEDSLALLSKKKGKLISTPLELHLMPPNSPVGGGISLYPSHRYRTHVTAIHGKETTASHPCRGPADVHLFI